MKRAFVVIVGVLAALICFAGKRDDLGPTANISFLILKDANGKPVRNASVVLHLVDEKGKQEKGGIELKTDADGKASYDTVPYGKVRVQVLMTGFQTYGEDYEVNQAVMGITIRIKRPEAQFSSYGPNGEEKKK